jgi:hypothetical protein
MYQTPNIFLLDASECMFAATQSAGDTGQEAFAASCILQECVSQSPDAAAFHISWQDTDNDESDAGGYTVRVNINGTVFDLTNNECNIGFNTGTFTMICPNLSSAEHFCLFAQINTLTIVSIEDPQGNVFSPSGEDCTVQNLQE